MEGWLICDLTSSPPFLLQGVKRQKINFKSSTFTSCTPLLLQSSRKLSPILVKFRSGGLMATGAIAFQGVIVQAHVCFLCWRQEQAMDEMQEVALNPYTFSTIASLPSSYSHFPHPSYNHFCYLFLNSYLPISVLMTITKEKLTTIKNKHHRGTSQLTCQGTDG